MLIMVLVSCVWIPYQAAFLRQVTTTSSIVVYAIDGLFLIDLVLNFFTSYRAQGVSVTDTRRTARRYFRSFFAMDLLGAIPFDCIFLLAASASPESMQAVLVLRLLRLVRVVRLLVILRRWGAHIRVNTVYLRIGKFLLVVVLAIHCVACAWFAVAAIDGFPSDSWVEKAEISSADAPTQYVRSLYWTVVTMTTVGYGDITPGRNIEYVVAIIVVLLGASVYAFVIANVASLLSNLDAAKAAYWNRIEGVHQYLRARHVPHELGNIVRDYYEYVWDRFRGQNQNDLFRDLPSPLRLEILLYVTRDLIESVPLFKHCSPPLRNELLLSLQPQVYAPSVTIVHEGEASHNVYFISRGTVEIASGNGETKHGTLNDGDYFGLLSLLLGENRTGSVRTKTYCDVFSLSQPDFERIKRDYPEFKGVLKRVAAERTDRIATLIEDGVVL
jgi:voltage-gated potassium channel